MPMPAMSIPLEINKHITTAGTVGARNSCHALSLNQHRLSPRFRHMQG